MKHSLKLIFTNGNENKSPADNADPIAIGLRGNKSAVISESDRYRICGKYFQMRKLNYLFIALGLATLNLNPESQNCSAQNYQWAKSIGSTGTDYGNSIATDASGNVYVTGYFGATADFDPGAGIQNLTPVGNYDIFFAKYSSTPTGVNEFILSGTVLMVQVYPNPNLSTAKLVIY